jgi:hypothetical protein
MPHLYGARYFAVLGTLLGCGDRIVGEVSRLFVRPLNPLRFRILRRVGPRNGPWFGVTQEAIGQDGDGDTHVC